MLPPDLKLRVRASFDRAAVTYDGAAVVQRTEDRRLRALFGLLLVIAGLRLLWPTGDVTAGEVKVYGKIEGKITSERCELKDKSKINGDIKSKVFSMEEGAQLSGRTEIGG